MKDINTAINFSQSTSGHEICTVQHCIQYMCIYIHNARSSPKSRCCLVGYKYSIIYIIKRSMDHFAKRDRIRTREKRERRRGKRKRKRGAIRTIIFLHDAKSWIDTTRAKKRKEHGSPSNCFSFHCPDGVEQRVDRNVQSASFERP